MRIAIVTDYLNVYGGGERTLEAILEIYPEADVFTSFYDFSKFRSESPIRKAKVHAIFSSYFLLLNSYFWKHLTFVMPFFFQRIDLTGYDLIISVGTIWAKGVKTKPGQRHIFYCLTPPRFLYGYPSETSKRNVWYYRPFTTLLDHWLRIWDFNAAQKPDEIVSISQEVQRRVKKFYRRDSAVIYPPVEKASSVKHQAYSDGEDSKKLDTRRYSLNAPTYFLIVSRLAAYKGIDVAIKACNRLNLPLKIVGTGKEERRLRKMSGPTIEFLGFRPDREIQELYRNCLALIFPTPDEDFGLVPLEANAHGVPVISHRSGGVLETMLEGKTAIFYNENTPDSLVQALHHYIVLKWSPEDCIKNAQRFGKERFQKEFKELIDASK